MLLKHEAGEVLYLYLAVAESAVSAVLIKEIGKKQHPVYYVSKALLDTETRYSLMEKLALAFVSASKKLRPYFQCHPIVVVTNYPLRNVLHKPDLSDRLVKWAIELSEFDISYLPRTTIKSQALADFVAEFSPNLQQEINKSTLGESRQSTGQAPWELHVDGSTHSKGTGVGIVLQNIHGDKIEQAIKCGFKATNNEVEYEALIAGLKLALSLGITSLIVCSDSQLVSKQVEKSYQTKDDRMKKYLGIVESLVDKFESFEIKQISREDNQ